VIHTVVIPAKAGTQIFSHEDTKDTKVVALLLRAFVPSCEIKFCWTPAFAGVTGGR
jgi:hypothetical protein